MSSRATLLTWILIVAAALLPIALLSVYTFGVAGNAVKGLARSEIRSAAHFVADVTQRDLNHALHTLRLVTLLPETRTAVLSRDTNRVTSYLQTLNLSLPNFDRVTALDENGVPWASFPPSPTGLPSDSNYDSWHAIATNGNPGISNVELVSNPSPTTWVQFFAPVQSPAGQHLGTFTCRYRLDSLSRWLESIPLGDTGEIYIVDPAGTVAAHPDYATGNVPPPQPDTLLDLSTSGAHEFTDERTNTEYIGARAAIRSENANWTAIAWQPRSEAYAPVKQLAARIGFASGILALAAAALVVVLEGSRKNNDRLNQKLKEHIQSLRCSEETLDRERFLLGTLMENIPDHIYFKDRESRFIRINPAMASVFKLDDPDEAIGKTDKDFFTEEHAEAALADEQEILRSEQPMVNREEKETWPDGSVTWVSTTKECLRDKSGEIIGTFGISRDITDRKRAEEALDQKAQELSRSNADLEQFAYAASHDLQEPLRMIASYTQLLARRYKDKLDDDAREFIDYAVDGATRMQVLINDLLTYSRVGTRGKPFEEIESDELLRRVQSNLQIAIEECSAEITISTLPKIRCDVTQLTQLLQNLLSNAIKFRGEAIPKINVSATSQETTDPSTEETYNEWVFTVQDNGIGIDPDFFDRIFVIFQRLHSRTDYPGTGIGLAVCKKIVERHGGRIWVESSPGNGTAFHFTIPHHPEEPES